MTEPVVQNNEFQFKLSTALKSLGRCITYYPSLAAAVGLKESIILCQLLYWTPKVSGEGWIYKTAEELSEETGLSYREQLRIRKNLVKQQLIEERHDRVEHRIYFRVCIEALDKIGVHMTNGQLPPDHLTKGKVAPSQSDTGTVTNLPCHSHKVTVDNKEHRLHIDDTKITHLSTRHFVPPTIEEVIAYCKERGSDVDPQRWHAYYTSNGWKVGRNRMVDWKAAVRTWEKNGGYSGKSGETYQERLNRKRRENERDVIRSLHPEMATFLDEHERDAPREGSINRVDPDVEILPRRRD